MQTVKENNVYKAVSIVTRHYWKREETETPWTQPVLSANGIIGGDSFACVASFEGSAYPAWKAFDNDTGNNTFWGSGHSYPVWLEWYNPNSIKISNIKITNGIDIYGDLGNLCDFYIQASDDGNVWENVYTGVNRTSGVKLVTNIDLSLSKSYKFWRLYCLNDYSYQQVTTSNGVDIFEIKITATTVEETITPGTAEDYDFYTDETVYNCWGNAPETIFESSTGGNYTINLEATGDYEVTCVGGGGAAAMRGVYDDKGYGWGGGSGGAFKGVFTLAAGSYTVIVGSANNNTTAQSGNTQTLNPTDTTTHDSSISGVLTCGGGGSGHYNTSYVGAAGAAPVFSIMPESTTINSAGNAGSYNSGGKGSAAAATCAGGASVYLDYGRGQGCKTSEYAAARSWINGTNGYVRIRRIYR